MSEYGEDVDGGGIVLYNKCVLSSMDDKEQLP